MTIYNKNLARKSLSQLVIKSEQELKKYLSPNKLQLTGK